ncbi:MAG: GspH/FimT family pseudopilin [Cocleimonas sp.]
MRNAQTLKKSNTGFTLIELMITLAIAVILITLAVPSFSLMIHNSKVTSATNEFVSALNLARSEALKRSNNVTVCKSNSGFTACSTTATDNYTTNGWLVFPDCGVLGTVDTTADCDGDGVNDNDFNNIIKIGESNENIDLTSTVGFITYDLSGRIAGATPTFNVKSTNAATNAAIKKNKVSISRIGRVKSEKI